MKILLIGEKVRCKENWEFSIELNLKKAFDLLGIKSCVWGLGYDNYNIPFSEVSKDYNIIFLLVNYDESGWVPDLSAVKKLKIFWSIDSHCILDKHVQICENQKIDILLNSMYRYLKYFKKPGKRCYWFPNAYASNLIQPLGIEKQYDLGFCGNYCNRKGWLDSLSKKFQMKTDILVRGDNMVRAINLYKIHWNRNIADDINSRTFETLGCGTFLITNETDRLRDLFSVGKHLVTYRTFDDCCDKVNYFLRHDEKRELIAREGYLHALRNHTLLNRAQQLIEIIGKRL